MKEFLNEQPKSGGGAQFDVFAVEIDGVKMVVLPCGGALLGIAEDKNKA